MKLSEYGNRLVAPTLCFFPKELDFPFLIKYRMGEFINSTIDLQRTEVDFDQKLNEEKKIIYCSLGTCVGAYNQEYVNKIYNSIIEGISQKDDYQLVLVANSSYEPKLINRNIIIVNEAPQLKILSKASIFITQGGSSSIRESLYFGVPMIIVPFWHDQFGNAARIQYHRLGIILKKSMINPSYITMLIDDLVQNEDVKMSLNKFQKILKNNNEKNVISFIERVLIKKKQ